MHEDKLVEIFVRCDDFYKEFEKFVSSKGLEAPLKKTRLRKQRAMCKRSNGHRYFLSFSGVQMLQVFLQARDIEALERLFSGCGFLQPLY